MEQPESIDWYSQSNVVLINPRMASADRQLLEEAREKCSPLQGHIWLTSSGSSGKIRLVALSKEAFLVSADAVNHHLQSSAKDVWLLTLPIFHVGAISIYARAALSGATVKCHSGKWDVHEFIAAIINTTATLTALVPTQVYDIVAHNLKAPSCLRAVIVGGGALSEKVYCGAIALGWKLLPSYGLTECCSQVATAQLDSWSKGGIPVTHPLKHVELKCDADGFLMIKSKALLTGYIENRWIDPKENGWLKTDDKATFSGGGLISVSREMNFVKIGGESVDMLRLEKILDDLRLSLHFRYDCAVVALEDDRLGHAVHLAVACEDSTVCNELVQQFKIKVLPFEQIRAVHSVKEIPRTSLNKIIKSQLITFQLRLTTDE